ncbi:hypothetical protein Tco_0402060 [Tanacetum coccineum]
MSDSDESGVTYTEVSSPFEGLSDIGSPRADDHEYLELPWMPEDPYVEAALQAPPSPDYVPGPEEPEQAPPSPDYVPGLEHADDEIVAEDQPYAEDASPTAQSPDYVPESDPEADPEEDDDEDPEEDPVDYPADGGDDGDDRNYHRMRIRNDECWQEADEMRRRALSSCRLCSCCFTSYGSGPICGETEPFETDESAATPPPHPSYRVTLDSLLPKHQEDRPEVTLPPRKRLGIALGLRYEVGESSSAAAARPAGGLRADYGFVATMDREIRCDPEKEDTDEVYTRLDDEQSQRQLLAGRLNMLFRDRRAHACTARLMETEARLSREAWGRSMDVSDLVRAKVMSLHTTVLAQQSEIRELQSADRRRQTVILELLAADYRRQRQLAKALKLVKSLQTQMAELQRQQGPAKGPAQPELPEEAGSSS